MTYTVTILNIKSIDDIVLYRPVAVLVSTNEAAGAWPYNAHQYSCCGKSIVLNQFSVSFFSRLNIWYFILYIHKKFIIIIQNNLSQRSNNRDIFVGFVIHYCFWTTVTGNFNYICFLGWWYDKMNGTLILYRSSQFFFLLLIFRL